MDQIPPHGKVGELPKLTFKILLVSVEAFLKLQVNMAINPTQPFANQNVSHGSCDNFMTVM